ncbi:ATP-dependent DNA helicase, RecQ family [Micromonospora purpureochromogenes]|uniref:DNA 3'-5' helicase n=1 Tax=Micromonospora purpureochromogenes TaxID=47872 RepID=A0A1C4UBR1_9ACTN|nr:DEAD/DEAH box helicase [Micromonospora purpureochromogenes]SCE69069.1 ATP-dependent DNA helicase, RecQ family [Micromonospora purpureochromogenes]
MRSVVAKAITADLIHDDGGVLSAVDDPTPTGRPTLVQRLPGPLRAVIVDVEAVIRASADHPNGDRRIFQIGAVRLSADSQWCAEQPSFSSWVKLPNLEWEQQLRSADVREQYTQHAVDLEQVLDGLRQYVADADLLVAYNGVGADFPILDDAATRAGQPMLHNQRRVDALYLAYAVWPHADSHRLAELADEVGVDRSGLSWHEAADDAELTARLLRQAAAAVQGWDVGVRELLCAVGSGSSAWDLLSSLLPGPVPRPAVDDVTVARVLADALTGLDTAGGYQPVRRGRSRPVLRLPAAVRGTGGDVDPHALAQAAASGTAERRAAQQQMAELLSGQIRAGRDALCEAPTGTGKSFAVLAAALQWLDGDPRRRAVIATYTKALQTQLGADIDRLTGVIAGLEQTADLVKGAANRLSLRALVAALTDAAAAVQAGTWWARTGRPQFAAQAGFRELLIYLTRRLITAGTTPQGWLARSADPVDLPMFLAEYIGSTHGPVLGSWLRIVSQDGDDYGRGSGSPLAAMTDSVAEALAGHRLVIANHALLMSRPDVFDETTLLIVDEAHALELAVTGAASAVVDYRLLENLTADLRRWADEQANVPPRLQAVVAELEGHLDTEILPRAGQGVFDAAGGEPGSRAATLASPFGGLSGDRPARQLLSRLDTIAVVSEQVHRQLAAYLQAPGMQSVSWWEKERAGSLVTRVARLADAAGRIVADARAILDQDTEPSTDGDGDSGMDEGTEDGEVVGAVGVDEEELGADGEDLGPDGLFPLTGPDLGNRVVYAVEQDLAGVSVSARRYGFSLTSAPIDLARDPQWLEVRQRFARIFYVSATLQVSGRWDYIRERLGLGPAVDAHTLPGPFDLAEQARLVCFTDFPSWAEQTDGAVRTVAHQLAGYGREVIRPDQQAAFTGGALVLTTATRAAAAITQRLQEQAVGVPVTSAPILGNARAARTFTETGGFCVATRGMWQGVDFPADRLSLVWINKLPFAPFADPIITARRAAVARRAELAGLADPDRVATESYYLPLAAMDLRQAVGRLIRSSKHRGVVVISDRKLAGRTALRRAYRRVFLESLEPGLLVPDEDTGEAAGGNLTTMADGWARIWRFLGDNGLVPADRLEQLCEPDALTEQTLLPATRKILQAQLTPQQEAAAHADGTLGRLLTDRCAAIGGYLRFSDTPLALKPQQAQVIEAVADGADVLALMPTGFGKSYTFQLPALALPGVTVVVSPLIALMADQALELNATVGGAVRALVGPMAESNSRRGKTEVAEQLTGIGEHGIKLVYVSPERLGNRRFQDLLRTAAAAGILRRVAVDEAHTFVQWGDDFRPSFRRAGRLLAELRFRYGVRVTAVTATANRSVREGLRTGLFGLPATSAPGEALVTVAADPLRPELAIYRRAMKSAGPNTIAGLTEEVAAACDEHAIFYCLTVKEVDAVYAHLREFVGDGAQRVRRFHGRLSEAEKTAVLTEFRDAPARHEDGYAPLLIVATSAFGLGVNRGDIRCVFVVSPPTDLAALYQQLGRAGRDQAGRPPADVTAPSAGLALGSGRGFRTVAWMAAQGLPSATLRTVGQAVLTAARTGGVLDPDRVTDSCMASDLAAGRLSRDDARRPGTVSQYRSAVVRALAVLAETGTVDDHGDFPSTVMITPLDDPARCDDHTLTAAASAVAALALTSPGRHRLTDVHTTLTTQVRGYRLIADDPAQTWAVLATLHDLGVVDVSQAGNNRTLIAVGPGGSSALPVDYLRKMTGHRARLTDDLRELGAWYDASVCANAGFAGYFSLTGSTMLPDEVCSTAACRCSTCWAISGDPRPVPALLEALNTPRPRPTARRDAAPYREAVQRYVRSLLWDNYRGLTIGMIHRVLHGDETYLAGDGRRRPLWPRLLYHRLRGVDPGIKVAHVQEAVNELAGCGDITGDGRLWRLPRYAERDAARARAQAVGNGTR